MAHHREAGIRVYMGSYCQLAHFFQTFWRLLRQAHGESPRSRSGRSDPATAVEETPTLIVRPVG